MIPLDFIVAVAGMVLFGAAALTWAVGVAGFLRNSKERPSLPLFNVGVLADYRTARRIAKRSKRYPLALRLFEFFMVSGLTTMIGLMVWLIVMYG